MSWLSKGLAKVGISKNIQQKLTKPLLIGAATVAAPFTGGRSLAAIPLVSGLSAAVIPLFKRPNPASSPIELVRQSGNVDSPSAILAGFQAAMNFGKTSAPTTPAVTPYGTVQQGTFDKYKVPILLGGAGVAIVAAFLFLKR